MHSCQTWLFSQRRGLLSIGAENDEMQLACEIPHADAEIIRVARRIWQMFYGAPRVCRKPRAHKGLPGKKKVNTLAGWRAKRAQHLKTAMADVQPSSMRDVQIRAAKRGLDTWALSMRKEAEFNAAKGKVRKLDMISAGQVLDSESTVAEIGEAKTQAMHNEDLRVCRMRDAERKLRAHSRDHAIDDLSYEFVRLRCFRFLHCVMHWVRALDSNF